MKEVVKKDPNELKSIDEKLKLLKEEIERKDEKYNSLKTKYSFAIKKVKLK